ncbi:MAG: carbohydrate ABC transporter permease [Chloroflexi bacterium]|nr:carbohydrate ABC transporter permease [Chloroflexota bacterium]
MAIPIGRRLRPYLFWLAVGLVLFFFAFPLYWMVITSFKPRAEATSETPTFIPWVQFDPTLQNYEEVLIEVKTTAYGGQETVQESEFPEMLKNSILISGSATLAAVILGTMAAYAFSRFSVPGENDLLFFILSTRMLPPVVVVIPIFLMFIELDWLNTFVGLFVLYTVVGLPFVVWIMKGFFDEIPPEYEEAAMIDGHSRLTAVFKIVIPEAIPGMLATAVFVLILAWNEYLFALRLNPREFSTAPIFLSEVIGFGRTEWGRMAATSVILVSPIIVFTFLVRNHLLRGVTFGAVRR